ncbi:hypothetical protein D3C87_1152560 [compost metagenome]
MGWGVETGFGVADHQRTCQFYIIGLVFPQAHGFQGKAASCVGNRFDEGMQHRALFGTDDRGLTLEQDVCSCLFTNGLGKKLPS